MGTEAMEKLSSSCDIKVHSVMCTQLIKLVNQVDKIFPEIEAARPRCSSGIESLCLLISGIDKAKLLIQDCCESSKLYLALTGNSILSRCTKAKNLMEQSLSQIYNMVPVMLASKISHIIGELRVVEFSLHPSEEEAGKAVRSLLDGYRTTNHSERESEKERIQIAAQKLQITSEKALLLEQRSIKKLLGQLDEGSNKQQKKQILSFLIYFLDKYGKSIASGHIETDNNVQNQAVDYHVDCENIVFATLPEEFKCSIFHKLMYDTLDAPDDVNTWEDSTSSVNTLSSEENSRVVEDTPELDDDLSMEIDDALPWEFQCKFVEGLVTRLENDDWACKSISCENLVGSLVRFLKLAHDMNDVKAQRSGCLLLLILVTKCRCIMYLTKDAYHLIAEFLESKVTKEALAITEELSAHQNCVSKIASSGSLTYILKIFDTRIREHQIHALKILYNLTATRSVHSLIVSSDLISKLITLSEDDSLSRYCISILSNLCGNQDIKNIIVETNGCISFVTKALDSDNCEEQEHALEILLLLCSHSIQYCRLVMDEGVISSLFFISSNGTDKGKAKAHTMLRLLGDTKL